MVANRHDPLGRFKIEVRDGYDAALHDMSDYPVRPGTARASAPRTWGGRLTPRTGQKQWVSQQRTCLPCCRAVALRWQISEASRHSRFTFSAKQASTRMTAMGR